MDWSNPWSTHHDINASEVYCVPQSLLRRHRLNSDAGSEYTSQRYIQTLATEGLIPSIGTIG